eukprot:1947757-Amphidinium_carterae.1
MGTPAQDGGAQASGAAGAARAQRGNPSAGLIYPKKIIKPGHVFITIRNFRASNRDSHGECPAGTAKAAKPNIQIRLLLP